MYFKFIEESIYSLNMNNIAKELKMYYLSQMIFYNEPTFFHYHTDRENNESSLLISSNSVNAEFLSFFLRNDIEVYQCLQITNTTEYLNESGLVNRISYIFSQQNVPILYITTLTSNFVLFEEQFTEQVNQIIQNNSI
jgi:hypothetical protein